MHKRIAVSMKTLSSALLAASIAGCAHDDGQAQAQGKAAGMPPTPVAVMKAALRDVATFTVLDGQIAPSLSSSISLQQAGTISETYVQEGAVVEKGQVLAHIDDRVLRAQLAQNEALLTQAAARLKSSNLTVPINNAAVDATLVAAREQLTASRNALKAAEASLHTADVVNTSNERLFQQGYLAQTAFEQNRASYVSAQQTYASAKATVAQNEAALKSAQRNTGKIGVQEQDVAANRGAYEQAQAQVKLLKAQVDQTTLRAPFDGVVTARLLDPGAYAGPNQPIFQVASLNPVFVNFGIPDDQLALVKEGTQVSFTPGSGRGKAYEGHVASLNTIPANGTLQYRARVIVPNPDNTLRSGMLVSVAIRRDYAHDALVVPRTAIGHGMDGKTNVFVVQGDKVKSLPITVGLQTDTVSQITSDNVHPGDAVVSTRPDTLADGAAVKIAQTSEVPATTSQPPRHVSTAGNSAQGGSSE